MLILLPTRRLIPELVLLSPLGRRAAEALPPGRENLKEGLSL